MRNGVFGGPPKTARQGRALPNSFRLWAAPTAILGMTPYDVRRTWECWITRLRRASPWVVLAVVLPMLGPGAAQAANAPRIPNVAAGYGQTVGLKADGTVLAAGGNA